MGNLLANLHNFLLACCNTSHAATKEVPPILMFGHHLHSKLDILKPAAELVQHQQFIQSSQCSMFEIAEDHLDGFQVLWYSMKYPVIMPPRCTRHGPSQCGIVTKISFSWVQLTSPSAKRIRTLSGSSQTHREDCREDYGSAHCFRGCATCTKIFSAHSSTIRSLHVVLVLYNGNTPEIKREEMSCM